jgi:broad specificity phosphatase PhoE
LKVYLIRHGESTGNQIKAFQGWNNVHLSEIGLKQANALSNYFKVNNITFKRIFSSPLIRATETANSLKSRSFSPDITLINQFKSINVGTWSGKTVEEVQVYYPRLSGIWKTTPEEFRFPNGESVSEVLNRAKAAFKNIIDQETPFEGNIAIVTHMITIKVLMLWMMQLEISQIWDPMFSIPNTGFVVFEVTRKPNTKNLSFKKVSSKNTTPHLN